MKTLKNEIYDSLTLLKHLWWKGIIVIVLYVTTDIYDIQYLGEFVLIFWGFIAAKTESKHLPHRDIW